MQNMKIMQAWTPVAFVLIQHRNKGTRVLSMDIGECWNDRPGFGVNSVSQKLSSNNYTGYWSFMEQYFS